MKQQRGGFLLQETLMAILIVTAAIAGGCQLLNLVAAQRRSAEYHAIASLEAANVMENVLSQSWNKLTTETVNIEMSTTCRHRLPSPKLTIDIVPDVEAGSKRIAVQIDWRISDNTRAPSVRLVAWRYENKASTSQSPPPPPSNEKSDAEVGP